MTAPTTTAAGPPVDETANHALDDLEREFFDADHVRTGAVSLITRAGQIVFWASIYGGQFAARILRNRLTLPAEERTHAKNQAKGYAVRRCMQTLGATFIKVGQILSSRPDLFPPEVIDELSLLQDKVPPFDPKHLDTIFASDFGRRPEDLFATFDRTPIASASVAQVHEGALQDGARVAVKILRPDIRRNAIRDLRLMQLVARLLEKLPSMHWMSPTHMVDEFARSLAGQLDLRREAHNNQRFRAFFEGDEIVSFPYVYPEYSTEHVMTMEYIDGVKIADLDLSTVDADKLSHASILCVGRMIFDFGLIHCDLHPGNVLFTKTGVSLLDVGMVAELTPHWREQTAKAMYYRLTNDGANMARQFYNMAEHSDESRFEQFKDELTEMLNEHYDQPLQNIEFSKILNAVLYLLRKHRLKMNMTWIMAMMAGITGEGVGKKLNPNVKMEEVLLPKLAARFGKEKGV